MDAKAWDIKQWFETKVSPDEFTGFDGFADFGGIRARVVKVAEYAGFTPSSDMYHQDPAFFDMAVDITTHILFEEVDLSDRRLSATYIEGVIRGVAASLTCRFWSKFTR